MSGDHDLQIGMGLVEMDEAAAEYLDEHPPPGYWVRHAFVPPSPCSCVGKCVGHEMEHAPGCLGCAWGRGEIPRVPYGDLPQWVRAALGGARITPL